jgi:hypothetical protein
MTRKWIAILVVLTLTIAATLLPAADDKSILKAVETSGVIFDQYGYKLKLTRMESKCDVNLGRRGKKPSTYSLEIDASCKMPDDVDGVLITEQIKVLKALTANGTDIRLPPKKKSSRSSQKYRSGTYTPILYVGKKLRVAEVKVSKLELKTNPYRIDKLETELAVIIAVKRTKETMPAVVSQTLKELTTGLKTRVSSMRINVKRELTVELTCSRQFDGPKGAFIEAIRAVDASGKTIGEARIHEGDPLGQNGKVTAAFTLTGNAEPTTLVATIVTEAKMRRVPFEITGIFQK